MQITVHYLHEHNDTYIYGMINAAIFSSLHHHRKISWVGASTEEPATTRNFKIVFCRRWFLSTNIEKQVIRYGNFEIQNHMLGTFYYAVYPYRYRTVWFLPNRTYRTVNLQKDAAISKIKKKNISGRDCKVIQVLKRE